jgi:hypothetical protein
MLQYISFDLLNKIYCLDNKKKHPCLGLGYYPLTLNFSLPIKKIHDLSHLCTLDKRVEQVSVTVEFNGGELMESVVMILLETCSIG